MISKPIDELRVTGDARLMAGHDAERQMAHYLHRAFAQDPEVRVLNGLRLVDPDQPEHHGGDGVAQIDHLVLHRWGAFIIESKSVSEVITVRGDGSGGDEWTRTYKGKVEGIASPVRQAERQGDFLRRLLQRHREQLLGKIAGAAGAIAKLVLKTDQRGFSHMPIQIVVAISDKGVLERRNGWTPPVAPFRAFVCKADEVVAKIQEELSTHRSGSSLLSAPRGEYGLWEMKPEEVEVVARFLADRHTPRTAEKRARVAAERAAGGEEKRRSAAERGVARGDARASAGAGERSAGARSGAGAGAAVGAGAGSAGGSASAAIACKKCAGTNLTALWGKSYYFKCGDCGGNTAIPVVCSLCDAKGSGGKVVRIRKEGLKFFRRCEACGIEECVWTNRAGEG